MSAVVLQSPWIISRRSDLTWFIGTSGLGYLVLAAFVFGTPVLPIAIAWNLLIDGPHIFATVTRTYFDKSARQKLGWRLLIVLPLLTVGPLLLMAGFGKLFTVLFLFWANFHIAKQHVGFVMLWKRKTGERSDFNLDKRFIVISLVTPVVLCFLHEAGVSRVIGPVSLGYTVLAFYFIVHQIRKRIRGEVCNQPKLLLLSVVIPLQWIAFAFAIQQSSPDALLVAGIATNIGHGLQYQRLTWFHNRNRYVDSGAGLALFVNSSLPIFLLTAIVLNLVLVAVPQVWAQGHTAIITAFLGFNMTHYYLDSLIWRVRGDKELALALRL